MRSYQANRYDAFKQGATGFCIVAGLGICLVTGVLMMMFAGGGVLRGTFTREPITNKITDAGTMNWVPITFVFFCVGVLMVFGAVAFGLYTTATEHSGPRQAQPAKVLARYAFNREGLMLVADWEIEMADRPRYYVRLDLGYGLGTVECECAEPVFYQCGEGMNGTAELQGKWLGGFHPAMGAAYQSEHIQHTDQAIVHPRRDE